MKIIKKVLIAIAVIIAIPLIIALFVKKEYAVEKSIIIEKPKSTIFEYIKYLKNQDNYSKWGSLDPNMKKSYYGTDGTKGFVAAWESDHESVGSREQEILTIIEGEKLEFELRFIKPFESTQLAYMTTESISENQAKLNWGFKGTMKYPTNFMLLFMDFETLIGEDFQTGLNNLKTILEN